MKRHRLWNHIACWAFFIVYEVSIARYMGDRSSLLVFGCFYILSIVLFYFNVYGVLDSFWPKKSLPGYITIAALILLELTLYSYLSVVLKNMFGGESGIQALTHIDGKAFVSAVWRGVYFIALSTAYYAVIRAIRAVKETAEVRIRELNTRHQKERLEKNVIVLQNAYLQAQINPHFLYNTLNFIYSQALEGNRNTSKHILLLSEIMQYSLASTGDDGMVLLCQEIDHIRRYIDLNLSRFNNTLFLEQDISVEDEDKHVKIPPLILLTYVENVFKHGDMTDRASPAIIRISYVNGLLTLFTKNKKMPPRKERQAGWGQRNALTRLEKFYSKDDVYFSEESVNQYYIVNLKLKL